MRSNPLHPAPVLHRARSLVEICRSHAQTCGARPAYTWLENGELETASWSFEDVDRRARAMAGMLQAHGLAGQRVLLVFLPRLDFLTAFLGCLYAGSVAVPALPPRPNESLDKLAAIRGDSRAGALVGDGFVLGYLRERCEGDERFGGLQWISAEAVPEQAAHTWKDPNAVEDTVAFLQYTSGSTGTPKGVVVTHGSLLANELMILHSFGHTEASVFLSWLPLFHDMGLIGMALQPLCLANPCILMSPEAFAQKPVRWLQAITRYRATTSGGPNFAYELSVRRVPPERREGLDLGSWDVAFNGAEPVRAETLDRFAEAYAPAGFRREALYPCYGLAEATLFVSGGWKATPPRILEVDAEALQAHRVEPVAGEARRLVSVGRGWLEQDVRIVDPETHRELPPCEVGEIWVAGSNVAGGYEGRPRETEQLFAARLAGDGAGPFLRTGDLGFVNDGELYVTGRISDMIILRGRNHYPHDIEATAGRSHPDLRVGCTAAFGTDRGGEECLVVVQEVRATALDGSERLPADASLAITRAVRQAVNREHGVHAEVVALVAPGAVPKTSSGKVQRRRCRALLLEDGLRRADGPAPEPTLREAAG